MAIENLTIEIMNFTLISLSLANFSLASPLFSPSFNSISSLKMQTFSKLHIAHSTQSFLYMKSYLSPLMHRQQSSILFSNSHFTHFLHSPISISEKSGESQNKARQLSDSDNDNKPRIFNREKIEYTIYSCEDVVLKAIDCIFLECTESISGGAIDMICEESSLYVIKCCFINCFAQSQGGAISFFGNLIKVNDTCFDGCYTMDSSMAMEVYVKGSREKVSMKGLSITRCADRKLFDAKREDTKKIDRMHDIDGMGQFGVYLSNVIDLNRGKQKLKAINSTYNIVHLTGGFCISDESRSFSLTYSTIVNNIADSLFNLYDIISNKGNMSYCNVLNNTASLSLTLFDLENSSMVVSYCTFLQNNLSFIASNGNLLFENCAYDFNSKNPPLENAEFSEVGSIFHKLKNWRSAKTVVFDKEQIENNAIIYGRCRKNKPRYSRNEGIYNQRFNNNYDRYRENEEYDGDNSKNKKKEDIINNKDEEEENDNKIKKKYKDEEDNDKKNKYDKNDKDEDRDKDEKKNKNDDDNDDINIFNNKKNNINNFINRNNKNKNDDDEEEDDRKNKNKKNLINNNQIQIADNEEEEEGDVNNKNNDKLAKETADQHSKTGIIFFVFGILFLGIIVCTILYFVKNRERDINELQDVELL